MPYVTLSLPDSPALPFDNQLTLPHPILGANADTMREIEQRPCVMRMLGLRLQLECAALSGLHKKIILTAQGTG